MIRVKRLKNIQETRDEQINEKDFAGMKMTIEKNSK